MLFFRSRGGIYLAHPKSRHWAELYFCAAARLEISVFGFQLQKNSLASSDAQSKLKNPPRKVWHLEAPCPKLCVLIIVSQLFPVRPVQTLDFHVWKDITAHTDVIRYFSFSKDNSQKAEAMKTQQRGGIGKEVILEEGKTDQPQGTDETHGVICLELCLDK